MDTLPEDVKDTIFQYKHEMEFREVVRELNTLGRCCWCWGRTCCKTAKCLDCGCVRICSNGNYGDGSDLIVLDSDCKFCSGRTRCEIDNSLNCMTCMYCGNTYYDNDSGDDSDLIILDSDSNDSDLIVL